MKVYITKYALTRGIIEADARLCEAGGGSMVMVRPGEYYHNDNWHQTRAEAEAVAESMRVAKLEALQKQVAKLTKKTFKEKAA